MIVVCDIDGTIADISQRIAVAGKQPKSWVKHLFPWRFQRWLDLLQSNNALIHDTSIPGMRELLCSLAKDYDLVYLTGRSSKYKAVTRAWLDMKGFPPGHLIMRHIDSLESAAKLKERHMKRIACGHDTVLIFDDDGDGTCEEMYKRNKWTHLKAMRNT